MDIQVDHLIERYDFDSVVYGQAKVNPILYRFVLPKWYFKAPLAVEESQMPEGVVPSALIIRRNGEFVTPAISGEIAQSSEPVVKA